MLVPQLPNDRWSIDFVADSSSTARLRILIVVDDCTRECLALVADTSISGTRVARELDQLLADRGKPKMIVSDNGTELTSNGILQWADDHKVAWHYIATGKSAECFRRVIHWPVARRVAQRNAVPLTATYSRRARSVACRLQHQSAHSRLGWMSPAIYAADRRSAALRSTDGSASLTAVITAQQGNADRQTPIATG
jgi:putative transposase